MVQIVLYLSVFSTDMALATIYQIKETFNSVRIWIVLLETLLFHSMLWNSIIYSLISSEDREDDESTDNSINSKLNDKTVKENKDLMFVQNLREYLSVCCILWIIGILILSICIII